VDQTKPNFGSSQRIFQVSYTLLCYETRSSLYSWVENLGQILDLKVWTKTQPLIYFWWDPCPGWVIGTVEGHLHHLGLTRSDSSKIEGLGHISGSSVRKHTQKQW